MSDKFNGVGEFLAVFNEIEAQTYAVLKMIPVPKLSDYAMNIDQFKPRVMYIQALLYGRPITDSDKFADLFDEALSLASYRNDLCHNPYRIKITPDDKSGKLVENEQIVHAKKATPIKQALDQLPARTKKAKEVLKGLHSLTASTTIVNEW